MALIVAQADAKIIRQPKEGLGAKTSFFNFPDDRSLPHASMNGHTGNVVGDAHFHINDQFQVVVDGEFSIGRHQLSPYCVHFSRAYTPYGPLIPKNGGDYTFVVMRAHWDAGPQFIANEMEQLRAATDRQPWQISRRVNFPPPESRKNAGDVMLQAVPDVKDDNGLAVHTLVMKPNAKTSAPNPAHTDGQYVLVVKGGLWHENKEHKAMTLVFVKPGEGPYQLHAGPEGLEAIVLSFPERTPRSARAKTPAAAAGAKKWQCALCAFEYDETVGMPDEGVPAGTRWEDVPDTWMCPDCSAAKSDFQMVEVLATAEVG